MEMNTGLQESSNTNNQSRDLKMKQEAYIKISEKVRKIKHGERIVQYGNILVTRLVYIMFLCFLLMLCFRKDERVIRVILVTGISFVLVSIFRKLYNEPRPYTVYTFNPILKKAKEGESMPSRHVFSGFVISIAFLYVNPLLSIPAFICSLLMCFGRVVAGVHFPKDVIVGAVIGIFSGVIGFWVVDWVLCVL